VVRATLCATPLNARLHVSGCRQLDAAVWSCAEAGKVLVCMQLPHHPCSGLYCTTNLARMLTVLRRHDRSVGVATGLESSLVAACTEALVSPGSRAGTRTLPTVVLGTQSYKQPTRLWLAEHQLCRGAGARQYDMATHVAPGWPADACMCHAGLCPL
jgi:hypothetical protein